ncbi:hypothetical protein LR48_Vigan08g188700 [Vigna angularis]|uniref:Uncharacterized protein n=2 Tax=Phaseolus angularis TaxID=3914 RepID=A0A0L9V7M0_PHAAN|nr:uncharacterized protein LOC108338923 [Vigna angularis]KAG2398035.1 uncharacterized protein HKW66_Vig0137290 [Vigna angularis]KOM51060.1 hypothetical protein LR48_Vigan08g188700 [Vigna angularis]BAT91102.1 hypothetical protein VIGAN_06240900 [Vigna angularis var. angularis]
MATNFQYDKTSATTFLEQLELHQEIIPLLIEVCSSHPSLLDNRQGKSRDFVQGSLNALGKVLLFLKTNKVRDMNDDNCHHLQVAWRELQYFNFNLEWLKPYVDSAVEMRNHVKKFRKVKEMEANINILEYRKNDLEYRKNDLEYRKNDLEYRKNDLEYRKNDLEKQQDILRNRISDMSLNIEIMKKEMETRKEGYVELDMSAELEYPK